MRRICRPNDFGMFLLRNIGKILLRFLKKPHKMLILFTNQRFKQAFLAGIVAIERTCGNTGIFSQYCVRKQIENLFQEIPA